ncbi:hypothetical protein [Peterkaempfera bronchialis]|uniref:Uncharacterized protein n=1 Tax=Peterkaempfera bronchialis TaxID=2126346 RepID=A0A345SVX0_9ACTN|nr:hypothetical protein [Peterkaempfera bronchialis]AXI77875.1 hypothetical protein C7M71_010935 [Peterkaempfera bronchialis]
MIELGYRVERIGEGADTPALCESLATASLYELTCEMFWGDLEWRVEGADFSGPGPVLDAAWAMFNMPQHLKSHNKRRYSAAEGAGEYFFTRSGDVVRIREEDGPVGTVSYQEFSDATAKFLNELLVDLCGRYPDLARNPVVIDIRSRVAARL